MRSSTWAGLRLIEEVSGECRDMVMYRTEIRRNRYRISIRERQPSGAWGSTQTTPWTPMGADWPHDPEQINDTVASRKVMNAYASQIEEWKSASESGAVAHIRSMPLDAVIAPLRGDA